MRVGNVAGNTAWHYMEGAYGDLISKIKELI